MNNSYDYLVELGGDYLEHHGVKGMKWGVRKSDRMYEKYKKKRAKYYALQQKYFDKNGKYKPNRRLERKALRASNAADRIAEKIYKKADDKIARRFIKNEYLSKEGAAYELGMNRRQKRKLMNLPISQRQAYLKNVRRKYGR